MRIGIIPDAHVGVVKFRKSEGFRNKITIMNDNAFEEAFKKLYDKNVDKIIQVGDVFDGPEPDIHSILEVNKTLSKYKDKMPISIISGNHDYSQRSSIHGYHVFDVIDKNDNDFLNLYNEGLKIEIDEKEKVIIEYVPYKALGEKRGETFSEITKSLSNKDDYFKILIFHGSIDYDGDKLNDEYDMPTEITNLFDFVALGHVHYPRIMQVSRNKIIDGNLVSDDVYHLTPGALIPSAKANQNTQRPSVYVFDTKTNKVEVLNLDSSPFVFEYNDIEDINKVLEDISNSVHLGIYSIRYNGKMSDIDDSIYMKALDNSINISIQAEDNIGTVSIKEVKGFWEFIKSEYPQYENEFREVVSE